MFERYTEPARRSIFFARYEASQFGSHSINPEHLLLGILREDRALADRLLGQSGVPGPPADSPVPEAIVPEDIKEAEGRVKTLVCEMESAIAQHDFKQARELSDRERRERENLRRLREEHNTPETEAFEATSAIRARIESVSPRGARISTSVDLPLSQECKRAVAYGAEEAERLHHVSITPGHLLIGLLREKECLAAKILHERGLTMEAMRAEAASWTPSLPGEVPPYRRAFVQKNQAPWATSALYRFFAHPEAARFYHMALGLAAKLHSPCIETKHLLLALVEQPGESLLAASAAAIREQIKPEPLRRETISAAPLPPTEECLRAFSYATEEAGRLGQKQLAPEHLALGLLREESCEAAEILRANGFTIDRVRRVIAEIHGAASSEEPRSTERRGEGAPS